MPVIVCSKSTAGPIVKSLIEMAKTYKPTWESLKSMDDLLRP